MLNNWCEILLFITALTILVKILRENYLRIKGE